MRTTRVGPERAAIFLLLAAAFLAVLPGCSEPLSKEQRLADLDYLVTVLSENHPYVSLKSRVEGYDWSGHRDEFESMVAGAGTDQEFAAAMDEIVRLVNNMHTSIRGRSTLEVWSQESLHSIDWLEPWLRVMDGVDLGKAEYYQLASRRRFGNLMAVYSGGQYVITERVTGAGGKSLLMGSRVVSVDGVDIDEFVRTLRDIDWQPYDPIQKHPQIPVADISCGVGPGGDGKVHIFPGVDALNSVEEVLGNEHQECDQSAHRS